jgi:hypothetical protein
LSWVRLLILFLLYAGIGFFLPWYSIVLPAVLLGADMRRPARAFILNFLLGAGFWISIAIFRDLDSHFRLAARLSSVLMLPNAPLAFALTGLVGGLVCALAGLAGACALNAGVAAYFSTRKAILLAMLTHRQRDEG